MKSPMKWSIRLMLMIVLFLISGSILMSTKVYETIFFSPLSFILLGAFTVIMIVCSFKQGFSVKKIGFQLCHLGIVVILLGACIGYFAAVKTVAVFPLNATFDKLQTENGKVFNLNFKVSVTGFQVSHYDPDYYLLKALNGDTKSNDNNNFKNLGVFKRQFDGSFYLKGYNTIDESVLKDKNTADGWRARLDFKDDMILVKAMPKDKHYLAKLKLVDSNNREIIENLEVNHPVNYKGWKFYLTSYDREQNSYVVLTARRDPGTALVIYGIWAVILGTIILCFRKRNFLQGGKNNE